ncbi:MAG: hypothetical protein LBL75_03890 [Rickettsiales bacterium]|jgi:hypothetical protein|nr:hypothetical protein [Rickettsiales bacterium]
MTEKQLYKLKEIFRDSILTILPNNDVAKVPVINFDFNTAYYASPNPKAQIFDAMYKKITEFINSPELSGIDIRTSPLDDIYALVYEIAELVKIQGATIVRKNFSNVHRVYSETFKNVLYTNELFIRRVEPDKTAFFEYLYKNYFIGPTRLADARLQEYVVYSSRLKTADTKDEYKNTITADFQKIITEFNKNIPLKQEDEIKLYRKLLTILTLFYYSYPVNDFQQFRADVMTKSSAQLNNMLKDADYIYQEKRMQDMFIDCVYENTRSILSDSYNLETDSWDKIIPCVFKIIDVMYDVIGDFANDYYDKVMYGTPKDALLHNVFYTNPVVGKRLGTQENWEEFCAVIVKNGGRLTRNIGIMRHKANPGTRIKNNPRRSELKQRETQDVKNNNKTKLYEQISWNNTDFGEIYKLFNIKPDTYRFNEKHKKFQPKQDKTKKDNPDYRVSIIKELCRYDITKAVLEVKHGVMNTCDIISLRENNYKSENDNPKYRWQEEIDFSNFHKERISKLVIEKTRLLFDSFNDIFDDNTRLGLDTWDVLYNSLNFMIDYIEPYYIHIAECENKKFNKKIIRDWLAEVIFYSNINVIRRVKKEEEQELLLEYTHQNNINPIDFCKKYGVIIR